MKNKFAHCMTTISYSAWILGSFLFTFYSVILPKRPSNDYIHYKNYFLISTIIIIALQEINFQRIKLKEKKNPVKLFTMEDFSNVDKKTMSNRNLKFVDSAFEDVITKSTIVGNTTYKSSANLSTNGEEDVSFDISQFKNYDSNKKPTKNMLYVAPEITESESAIMIRPEISESKFKTLINNNQTFIVIILIIMLIAQYVASTIILFKSVTVSHFLFITPFIHPISIFTYLISKKYSCYFCLSK
jgi:hypothetical protein